MWPELGDDPVWGVNNNCVLHGAGAYLRHTLARRRLTHDGAAPRASLRNLLLLVVLVFVLVLRPVL